MAATEAEAEAERRVQSEKMKASYNDVGKIYFLIEIYNGK